jgi:hypothetical protein
MVFINSRIQELYKEWKIPEIQEYFMNIKSNGVGVGGEEKERPGTFMKR